MRGVPSSDASRRRSCGESPCSTAERSPARPQAAGSVRARADVADFTVLADLASERLGGRVLFANDDFFAEKENLLRAEAAVFVADRYTDRGKWMDGWGGGDGLPAATSASWRSVPGRLKGGRGHEPFTGNFRGFRSKPRRCQGLARRVRSGRGAVVRAIPRTAPRKRPQPRPRSRGSAATTCACISTPTGCGSPARHGDRPDARRLAPVRISRLENGILTSPPATASSRRPEPLMPGRSRACTTLGRSAAAGFKGRS